MISGTPQKRCREMHQSGRSAIIEWMRSRPQAGVHCTLGISAERRWRSGGAFGAGTVARPVIQLHEPLLGGAKNHRIVAAPAVRIAVLEFAFARPVPRATSASSMTTGLASKTVLPLYSGKPSMNRPSSSSGAYVSQAVFLPDCKVFRAMARRGVHDAGALLERDVLAEHAGHNAIQKRMLKFRAFENLPWKRPFGSTCNRSACFLCDLCRPIPRARCTCCPFSSVASTYQIRMKRQRHAGRQRPGSSRPDQRVEARPSLLRRLGSAQSQHRDSAPRSTGWCDLRIRLRLRPAPCDRKCTSTPASARDTRSPFRET